MIKFFRKIRQDLLGKNKFSKYSLYAIGEILLVVIGILIALQINNWNEQRKNRVYFESLLDSIEEDLKKNIEHANSIFRFYDRKGALSKLVLDEKVSRRDYLENDRLRFLLTVNRPLKLVTDNVEKLIEKEELVPEKYVELLPEAKAINNLEIELDRIFEDISDKTEDNITYITMNYPAGYKQDSALLERRINQFLTDEVYKKRVYLSWTNFQQTRNRIAFYRATALGMLGRMKRIRNNYDASQIKQLYQELEMIPFQQFACQDPIIEYEKNARESHLIANLSPRTINFSIMYLDEFQKRERTLQANEFRVFGSAFRGIRGAYNWVIEIKKEGGCQEKYVTRKNGYLIIE